MTRRTFIAAAASARLAHPDAGWIELFNGRDMNGWRPSENKTSWKIHDGQLAADGPRSHLFYTGPVHGAMFRNFALEVEALARPQCNSGVYFHTAYQERGFPIKGFEVQINNTAAGEGTYRERKKTGSLYGVRNIYKQLIADDQWFRIRVTVRGKNVQIRLDDVLVVDYTEPNPPVIPDAEETERFLSQGTFALQCHNEGSKALFRSVRVMPLPDDTLTPGPIPVADDVFRQVIQIGRHNLPMVDYHVNLTGGLTLEQALRNSRRDGLEYGVVHQQYDPRLKTLPVFAGLAIRGGDVPPATAALFDYTIGGSSLIGKRPIDICSIGKEDNLAALIPAIQKNGAAIEINSSNKLPDAGAIRAAKAARCKFAFGTNNAGAADLGRSEYGLQMVEQCKLTWQDFFIPGAKRV